MPVFDELQPASFGDVKFPVREITVHGGIRYKLHEYPHRPGSKIEKLGRKAYEIDVAIPFHANLIGWPNLWPEGLSEIRTLGEAQFTRELFIPTIGAVPAVCVDWSQVMTAKVRSGEDVHLKFIEDTTNDFLFDALVQVTKVDLAGLLKNFEIAAEPVKPRPSLFDSISDLTLAISTVGDTVSDAANQVAAKVAQCKDLIETADRTLKILTRPDETAAPIIEALHDLWSALDTLERDIAETRTPLIPYVVPRTMSVGEISAALYRDGTRGAEIMQINPLPDPFLVKAGTTLQVYAE